MYDTLQEIRPVRFEHSDTLAERLLLVTDISVFWPSDAIYPYWTEEKIWDVMSWSDIENGLGYWNRLAVISRNDSPHAYRSDYSFQVAWDAWARHWVSHVSRDDLQMDWRLSHLTGKPMITDQFGDKDGEFEAHGKIFGREYFERYPAGALGGALLDALVGFGLQPLPNFTEPHTPADLADCFARGEIIVDVDDIHDGTSNIREVYLVGRADGEMTVRAFEVPRRSA